MRLLLLVSGDYGWRHVANLRQHDGETPLPIFER